MYLFENHKFLLPFTLCTSIDAVAYRINMASVMCVDTEMDLTHSIGGNIVINNNLEDTTMQCDQITILTI